MACTGAPCVATSVGADSTNELKGCWFRACTLSNRSDCTLPCGSNFVKPPVAEGVLPKQMNLFQLWTHVDIYKHRQGILRSTIPLLQAMHWSRTCWICMAWHQVLQEVWVEIDVWQIEQVPLV